MAVTVTVWTAIAAAALIVAGLGFIYWPAALIAGGVLLALDVVFDLRGGR